MTTLILSTPAGVDGACTEVVTESWTVGPTTFPEKVKVSYVWVGYDSKSGFYTTGCCILSMNIEKFILRLRLCEDGILDLRTEGG